jgi:3-hydroxybutyryl-CoA dehydrogenase
MSIETVGVVGAGVMGTGVAQNLAQAGFRVVLLDVSTAVLERARDEILKNMRFSRFFNKNEKHEPGEDSIERIIFTTDYAPFVDADFVIENATEKWDIKKPIYEQLEAACPAHCCFAANTSAISITRIASATRRPASVLGMHFMNPVPLKTMVEMIRGYHKSAGKDGKRVYRSK